MGRLLGGCKNYLFKILRLSVQNFFGIFSKNTSDPRKNDKIKKISCSAPPPPK